MQINKRITYLSYLIIGIIFIIAGLALKEPDILSETFSRSPASWYQFLMPWIGDSENGIPVPWK